jgi:hypothetical protein
MRFKIAGQGEQSTLSKPLGQLPHAISRKGDKLFVGDGDTLLSFDVVKNDKGTSLVLSERLKAPCNITAMSDAPSGLLLAYFDPADSARLARVSGSSFVPITQLPLPTTSIAAAGDLVAVLIPPRIGLPAEVLAIDARSGVVARTHPVSVGVTRLKSSASGAVSAIDGRLLQVQQIDLDTRCPEDSTPPGTDRDSCNPPRGNDRRPDCCRQPEPDRCRGDHNPPHGSSGDGRTRPTVPKPDHCRPGSDGSDDGCIRYTAVGTTIVREDICDPGRGRCHRNLFSRIEQLEVRGNTLVALTRQGGLLEVLDSHSLVPRKQMPIARGTLLLQAAETPVFLAVSNDLSQTILLEDEPPGSALDLQIGSEVSERIFKGTDAFAAPVNALFSLTQRSVLIIPVTYAGQNFPQGVGNDVYRQALEQPDGPLDRASRYYADSSYQLQNLDFHVFGAPTQSQHPIEDFYIGGPIEIDQPVADYYRGEYVQGGIETTMDMGPSPAGFQLQGGETLNLIAYSAVNAGDGGLGNPLPYVADFPAMVMKIDVHSNSTLDIPTTASQWSIGLVDGDGNNQSVHLDAGVLPSDVSVSFPQAGLASAYAAEVEEVRSALQTMLNAADPGGLFDPVEVLWGGDGSSRGHLYLVFRLSPAGGDVPMILDPGLGTFRTALSLDDETWQARGSARFLSGMSQADLNSEANSIRIYLKRVLELAEIRAAGSDATVHERVFGGCACSVAWAGGTYQATIRMTLSDVHSGSGIGGIISIGTSTGDNPLNLASGTPVHGSDFGADDHHTMADKTAFFTMLYQRMLLAVQAHLGNPAASDWTAFANALNNYDTLYTFPVEEPPATMAGAWSVSAPGISSNDFRAFVFNPGTGGINDPNGIGAHIATRWGMNFQKFPPDPDAEGDMKTLAHELGHTLGLSDMYGATAVDSSLLGIGSLDLMGNSSADWPHFCAYHKIALGWLGVATQWGEQNIDCQVISRPDEGQQVSRRFILAPNEWWDEIDEDQVRSVFGNIPANTPVTTCVLCDLGGDGIHLASIEARAPRGAFSGSISVDGEPGRVMVIDALDIGSSKRYGRAIADTTDLPEDVVDSLLRYRRKMHLLTENIATGDTFNLGEAPGLPVEGVQITVGAEASVTIDGNSVPVYDCTVDWVGGLAADLGFADNDEEWRSTDICIDYVGDDDGNPESGAESWGDQLPLGAGDKIVIPQNGEEPHEVVLRVHNFGSESAFNTEVSLYLRDPGGGGDLDIDEPFDHVTIPEVLPGPHETRFPWSVRADQNAHVCWHAVVDRFEIGEGSSARVIVNDASVSNNWVQQNIFETDVPYASPPEPLEQMFSVSNDGPFVEFAWLIPESLPDGVTLRVRPAELRVPAYSRRNFHLHFEFDEDMTRDACRRDIDVLLRCMRRDGHYEAPWGASLFRLHLRRKTAAHLVGQWLLNTINLSGTIEPPIGVGRISLRLNFEDGEPARWISANLEPGGVFHATFDATGIDAAQAYANAHYRGTVVYAACVSPTVTVRPQLPEG